MPSDNRVYLSAEQWESVFGKKGGADTQGADAAIPGTEETVKYIACQGRCGACKWWERNLANLKATGDYGRCRNPETLSGTIGGYFVPCETFGCIHFDK